jgi:hypothetical protein
MVNLIDPFPTSMCALAVLKKGLPRMSDTFESGTLDACPAQQNPLAQRILLS